MREKLKDLVNRFTSRTTMFCGGFFVAGHIMHLLHRLDATYITFMGTLLGFIVGHSVSENLTVNKQDPPKDSAKKADDPDAK